MRLSRVALLVLGITASALLGTSLVATVADSVSSSGNSIRSKPIAEAPNLKVGVLSEGEACTFEAVEDTTTIASLFNSSNITLQPAGIVSSQRLCFYNAGGEAAPLTAAIVNLVDIEANTTAGTCDGTEANPDGGNDTTCAVGEAGELSELLTINIFQPCPPEGCGEVQFPPGFDYPTFDAFVAADPTVIDASLTPGEAVERRISIQVKNAATQQQLRAAQTDRLQWDFIFALTNESE